MMKTLTTISDEDWIKKYYRMSNSQGTVDLARTSLNIFDQFCEYEVNLNSKSKDALIQQYQELFNQEKPDIRSICMSLDKFVEFMGEDHDDIMVKGNRLNITFKAKHPKTIKLYFGFIKNYLRVCHGIRITSEDIKDYIQFPKLRKIPRRPISLDTLKLLFGKCDPERRALYYVLISSGMRISEALSLKKSNFHIEERPIRITILADDTKTKEERETYITNEAWERVKPIYDRKNDDEYILQVRKYPIIRKALRNEEKYFIHLRRKLGLTEKYPNSTRCVVNIHSFRAYFHTKASQKHGSDYANALDGHGAYLKQYYREDPKERANKYLALEPSLLIESVKVEAEKTKDAIIENLESQMAKMQAQMKRIMILNLESIEIIPIILPSLMNGLS